MDNIFKVLDSESDAEPVTIQQKVKEANTIHRSGLDASDVNRSSKAITGRKNKMLRKGKERDVRTENRFLKKQKKNSARAKAKHSY